MSWFSSFIHPERGYEKGQAELDKYYSQAQGYQDPYNQMGQQAGQGLNTAIDRLMDPAALQNEWASGYETSPQALQRQEMAKQQGLNAMASQGVMGSTPALQAMQAGEAQIGLDDRQNYLNDLMQKYQTGIGAGQNMYNTGAQTAGQMGQNAMNMGQNSGQMAYNAQNAPGEMFGNMMKTGANLASQYATGGMGTGGFGRGALSPTDGRNNWGGWSPTGGR